MSKHDDMVRLRHMLEHAREAVALIQDKNRPDLEGSRLHTLALIRLIEIVGEAASRVSKARQRQHPQILWPQIIGMRNRLIHGYWSVDLLLVWNVIESDLPTLKAEVERLIAN